MSLLTVENLGKAYYRYHYDWLHVVAWFMPVKPSKEHWILRDINFSIQPGESIGILGQNGAGKSTLLKMITGIMQPTEGKISCTGSISAILELGMGFNLELTGRQNARHIAGLMGFTPAQITSLMPSIEAFAEIGEYFDKPLRAYSSGMQSRVAFAVATAAEPDLLIVDEALATGDAYFQAKCYERINYLKKKGMALMLVSHSVTELVKHCDRALFIQGGKLVKDGPAREVTNLYLDSLFVKQKRPQVDSTSDKEADVSTFNIASNSLELFNTRPGYRKDEYRWGNSKAAILDYLIVDNEQHYPQQIEARNQVDFYFKVRFDEDFDEVLPGFLIKTIEGIYLYAINSYLVSSEYKSIAVKKGDILTFKFSMPLYLNEGYYLISFGISSGNPGGEVIPLDRRYDAVIIKVLSFKQMGGVLDLGATFEIVNEGLNESDANANDIT